MHAFDFIQNSGQVNRAVGPDKFIRSDTLMARECFHWREDPEIIIAKINSTAQAMTVSIDISTAAPLLSMNSLKSSTVPLLKVYSMDSDSDSDLFRTVGPIYFGPFFFPHRTTAILASVVENQLPCRIRTELFCFLRRALTSRLPQSIDQHLYGVQ